MNLTTRHFAVDIEALAKSEKAIITAISCTYFNFVDDNRTYDQILENTFFTKIKMKDQKDRYGRVTDKETMDWWKTQPQDAQINSIIPHKDDVTLDVALQQVKQYMKANGYDFRNSYVWTRGIAYDCPKLESACRDTGISVFNSWKFRDSKTFYDIVVPESTNANFDLPNGNPQGFIKHHAKHDVALDVYKMLYLFNQA